MSKSWIRQMWCSVLPLAALLFSPGAVAQGFSAMVTPPRIEAQVRPGETYRNVLEITHASPEGGRYTLETNDWVLKPDGAVDFQAALAPGSCRPWVVLESRALTMGPSSKKRYRFEVRVPENAPPGQCRFAIMLEGEPQAVKGDLALPVSGRLGIIVYLNIGEVQADLRILGLERGSAEGRPVPVLRVENVGTAHGRLEGLVEGKDASGKKVVFLPSGLPILPGETRQIALVPQGDRPEQPVIEVLFPVEFDGFLEWDGKKIDVRGRIE